jgi:hypothetical protein
MRILFALASCVLAAAAIANFRREAIERASAEAFVQRFALDLRRPEEVGAMRYEPGADLAAGIAVDASLADMTDSSGPPRPAGAADLGQETAAGRDLMLDAMVKRPGWAYHRFLLGRLAYRSADGTQNPSSAEWNAWATPFRLAAEAAPGLDAPWIALANAYVQNWEKLSASQREDALPVIRRALQDPNFLAEHFLTFSEKVGSSQASSLLPDNAELLAAGAAALSAHGDLVAVKSLIDRAESSEKRERQAGLLRIEERYRMRDREGLASACQDWTSRHSVAGLDDPVGRSQAARVLELWPGDRGGPWDTDPRGELVRFFLDGREASISGGILSRTVSALSEVPDDVVARVKLRAGDVVGAQEVAAHPEDPEAFEWVPYYLDFSRFLLSQGRAREARGALDMVPVAGREDCEGLLARRDVARALGDTLELGLVNQRLDALRTAARTQDLTGDRLTLVVCCDPQQTNGGAIPLRLTSPAPALVQYGWGRGRAGTILLQGERVVPMLLAGRSGRKEVGVRTIAGGPVRAAIGSSATR